MDTDKIQQAKARLGIIGNAPGLNKAVGRALRVAPIDLAVLVTGESGAGKEFFPQIIHQYSPRKHAKYIAVNCGAIPEGTIDSELFGHEKGSFTGAVATRKGYFEEANGGTIFLDEVAELPLTTQARLLRVLESGEYLKVGSSEVQKTNIRVVAATNVDMERAVAEGRFREDLYYRLSTVRINVPPLHDRGNDIQLLARKFSVDFSEKNRTPVFSFTEEARDLLQGYRWPGNVRQLKNVVEQIALFEAGTTVDEATLREYLPEGGVQTVAPPGVYSSGGASRHLPVAMRSAESDHTYEREREMLFSLIFKMKKEIEELRKDVDHLKGTPSSADHRSKILMEFDPAEEVETRATEGEEAPRTPVAESAADSHSAVTNEKEAIRQALERNFGRRKAAALELNISERTLYRKIKEYGLE